MADRIRAVEWSESARAALDEAIAYINRDSPQNARLVLADALKTAASLMTFAERGRIVSELTESPTRELFVRGFRLMYTVTETTVMVVAFLRGRRDFSSRQRDDDAD